MQRPSFRKRALTAPTQAVALPHRSGSVRLARAAATAACLLAFAPSSALAAPETDVTAVAPEIVAASVAGTVNGTRIDPSLALSGEQLLATGTLSPAVIAVDPGDGFALGALDSPVTVTLDDVSSAASDARVVNGDSAIYAGTHPATDTIVRPVADGVESFFVLHDATAPKMFSWTIGLEPGQRLVSIDAQTVAIERPRTDPQAAVTPDELATETPVDPDASNVSDLIWRGGCQGGVVELARLRSI